MYNLAGFLCNYWIFPVGQSVSPILCLSWPYQCWYWSPVHTTITGLPHLLWLFLLCTTDQMTSVPVPAWLPGCCLAAAWLLPVSLPPLTSYFTWPDVRWRYVTCPDQDQLTDSQNTLTSLHHLPGLGLPHHHARPPAPPTPPSSPRNVDQSVKTAGDSGFVQRRSGGSFYIVFQSVRLGKKCREI